MNILRANHLGMCFGVRDALALAHRHAATQPLTVLGELVHNQTILSDLDARGVLLETRVERVATSTVMITAHGASEKLLRRVQERGLNVVEATCPLVHFAHRAVRQLVQQGYHPVIIGQRGHVEVRGLTEDLEAYDVILTEDDLKALQPHGRFGIAAQTTQPIERVRHLTDLIRARFPQSEVRFVDTVCQPTKQRQEAAMELARRCDTVVVVGGANSNNTHELAATCARHGAEVHHVQTAADLRPEWFEHAKTVGLTAGTSTPDAVIEGVEQWLRALAERHTAPTERTEEVHELARTY